MSQTNTEDLVARANALLKEHTKGRGFSLTVSEGSVQVDDGWIYLVVTPTSAGVRAYDYVEVMSAVEKALRDENFGNVLCVPAVPD